MAEVAEEVLGEKEITRQIEEAGEREGVHPLDPDFLVFALPFAIIVDILDIILEFTSFIVIPKIIGILFDIFTFIVIGGWIYWRTSRIAKSKAEIKKTLQKSISKVGVRLERQLARAARAPLRRVLIRCGIFLLAEITLLIGLIPFWTIAVLLTLREK